MNTKNLLPIFALLATLGLAACSDGPAEQAGENIDNATQNAGDAIENAADNAGDAIENAGDKAN